MLTDNDPTQRFSRRAESYVRYRPGYPDAVIATLREECSLEAASLVADVGSGTGRLTRLFLDNGNRVFAVEPNPEMRAAGERALREYPGFLSVAGRAEASTLAEGSVDFVVSGQAFHWFDHRSAREEFFRILKPSGWAMLIWNHVEVSSTAFLHAYEDLLRKYASYRVQVDHRERDAAVAADLFGSRGYASRAFRHSQRLDQAGVRGRILSLSSTPEPGQPGHEDMLAELAEIFRVHQVRSEVEFPYTATMYWGRLNAS